MGKYSKYTRHYVEDWEKESKFKGEQLIPSTLLLTDFILKFINVK